MHDEEVHNLYGFQDIVKLIKSKIMRWAGNVEITGVMINTYKIFVKKP